MFASSSKSLELEEELESFSSQDVYDFFFLKFFYLSFLHFS